MGAKSCVTIYALSLMIFSVGCTSSVPQLSEAIVLDRMKSDHRAEQMGKESELKYTLVIGYPKDEVIDLFGLSSLKNAIRIEFYGVRIGSYIRPEDQIPESVESIQMSDMYIDQLDFSWILRAKNIHRVDFSLASLEGDALNEFLRNTRAKHISLENASCDLLFRVDSVAQNPNIRYLNLSRYGGANDERVQELRKKRPDMKIVWEHSD